MASVLRTPVTIQDYLGGLYLLQATAEGPLTEDPSTKESHYDNGRVFQC